MEQIELYGRPLNVINDEIKNIEYEIKDIEAQKEKIGNIDNEKENIKSKIDQIKKELSILKEIKEYKNNETLEKQKIEINESKLNEYKNKIEELNNTKKIDEGKKTKKYINPLILLCVFVIIIGLSVLLRNIIILIVLGVMACFGFAFNFYNYNKYKKATSNENAEEIKRKKELELIEEAANNCKTEIENYRLKIEEMQTREEAILSDKYRNNTEAIKYIIEDIDVIENKIEKEQNEYNILALKENTLNIEQNSAGTKLENLVKQVERLKYLEEQKEELNKLSNSINYAQEGLQEAYKIMKNSVTPKFTNRLSKIIEEVTGGTYKNARFSDDDGLRVELQNGEYVNCNKLSIGTIDQMYFALRLAILDEISTENMPIILDEVFVYYDTERLENILNFISKEYANKQVIILTCTNRECEALDKLEIQFNLINI